MDIERTMEFIVENLAAVTVRQQETERSIRGLRTIVKAGMGILVKLEQNQLKFEQNQFKFEQNQQNLDTKIAALADAQIRTEESLKELAAAQKRTDQKFERWLDSMNKGSDRKSTRLNS